MEGRALHYVFKIGDRERNAKFFKDVLGMKVLRHEEFTEGCAAACNGPYNNRWSKTMMGYGPENTHFAIELTWNAGVDSYQKGNDFVAVTIKSRESIARAMATKWPITKAEGHHVLQSPDGYRFFIIDETQPQDSDPVQRITLASSDLEKTVTYWHSLLDLKVLEEGDESVILAYDEKQVRLVFQKSQTVINRGTGYGRLAFSVPRKVLEPLQAKMTDSRQKVLTPLITLDTPGKASVMVVILADPDNHEICFVDDEAFSELSGVEPDAEKSLKGEISRYNSFLKKRKQ